MTDEMKRHTQSLPGPGRQKYAVEKTTKNIGRMTKSISDGGPAGADTRLLVSAIPKGLSLPAPRGRAG
jgi:hypothetical protein